MAQLTEWPGRKGQPWRVPDSCCVNDELSGNLALLRQPPGMQHVHTRAHVRTCTHAHAPQAGTPRIPPRKKQHKGEIKEFLICLYLLAVKGICNIPQGSLTRLREQTNASVSLAASFEPNQRGAAGVPKCLISSRAVRAVMGLITMALTAWNEAWCGAVLLKGETLEAQAGNPLNRFLIISSDIDITGAFLTTSVLVCRHQSLICF